MAERPVKAGSARKRALVSCDRCKLRRARCIRDNAEEPCADCKTSGVRCESNLPRKQRVYGSVETLSLRYRVLESLVKGLFPQDNTQDVNILFKLAATRNIPMPASDDFTPADIFNKGSDKQQALFPHQPQRPDHVTQLSQNIPLSPLTATDTVRSTETTSSASTRKASQRNPFSEVQQPSRYREEMIPTRHGVSHYFGPSSSFRLATTIRGLVARSKAVSAADFSGFPASQSITRGRSRTSLNRSSTNPSDEEYIIRDSMWTSEQDSRGRKRSRSQMETPGDQWEHPSGTLNPDTIGDLLPSRSLADAIVAAYFDHIHMLLPLFNRSMFQFRLEATYSRRAELLKDCTDIGWLVALALVFSFGCQQLQEHDPEQARKLRLKFLSFSKSYFRQLVTTTCLVNVQALVLLNFHYHTVGQKSSSWLLIGLAARMAITMGMHRDGPNLDFEPIERNTRRQVWWTIYVFEKTLCSILGRPTVVDDQEITMNIPDAPMLDQKSISADFMGYAFELVRMSYSVRQRAYFDKESAEERSPTLEIAKSLLKECDEFFATLPAHFSLDISTLAPDEKARILLLHIYYHYTRCVVSRDFLIQKIDSNVCYLENRPLPISEDLRISTALSEDCVESAHKSLQCMVAGSDLGMIGYSFLDLFYVFHSVLIVCADFLARPKDQPDSAKDIERKETVRAMLNHVSTLRKPAPTYKILSQIALQFASITGVADVGGSRTPSTTLDDLSIDPVPMMADDGVTECLAEISDIQEDWFADATANLGLDFFDLGQAANAAPLPTGTYSAFSANPASDELDDWTVRTLRGMHNM